MQNADEIMALFDKGYKKVLRAIPADNGEFYVLHKMREEFMRLVNGVDSEVSRLLSEGTDKDAR